jgi:hypothetical protein
VTFGRVKDAENENTHVINNHDDTCNKHSTTTHVSDVESKLETSKRLPAKTEGACVNVCLPMRIKGKTER